MAYAKFFVKKLLDDYFTSGKALDVIADEYEVNRETVSRWVKADERYILNSTSQPDEPYEKKEYSLDIKIKAIAMKKNGMMYKDIAEALNLKQGSICPWVKKYDRDGAQSLMTKRDIEDEILKNKDLMDQINKLEIDELRRQLFEATFKNDVYEAVYQTLKKDEALSWENEISNLNNSDKAIAINQLRAQDYKLNKLLARFDISDKTYRNNDDSLGKADKWESYDATVVEFIEANPQVIGKQGYRTVMDLMRNAGLPVSERRIRKVMKQKGWLVEQRKAMRKHSSYKNDGNQPAPNYLYNNETHEHFFKPERPWEMLTTDVTEFHINDMKIYLSPIIDMHDSMPLAWSISQHPDAELMHSSLEKAIALTPAGKRFLLHSDQGSVYRAYRWKMACKRNHILQSMSRKGCSGDNAPCEGFFGRLKQEWFHKNDFTNFTYEMFVASLNAWLEWYCHERPQRNLGGLSPINYREKLDAAA